MSTIDKFDAEFSFLSNFYPCTVIYNYLIFSSVEAAYQAAKSNDVQVQKLFTELGPTTAKRWGKSTKLREDWENIKLDIMWDLIAQKFDIPELRKKLLSTGDAELIEGNWWGDTFWGVCKGVGQNNLGKLLMQKRNQCQNLSY